MSCFEWFFGEGRMYRIAYLGSNQRERKKEKWREKDKYKNTELSDEFMRYVSVLQLWAYCVVKLYPSIREIVIVLVCNVAVTINFKMLYKCNGDISLFFGGFFGYQLLVKCPLFLGFKYHLRKEFYSPKSCHPLAGVMESHCQNRCCFNISTLL